MKEPTTEQETEYDALLAAGADPDLAAYLTGIDECGCVMPHQSCRICRGAAKESDMGLDAILSMPSKVVVTALGDRITVACAPEANARVVDCYKGLQALVESGHYREYPVHIGGRTTPLFVAEPIEGAADGPTFTCMHPQGWKAVEQ